VIATANRRLRHIRIVTHCSRRKSILTERDLASGLAAWNARAHGAVATVPLPLDHPRTARAGTRASVCAGLIPAEGLTPTAAPSRPDRIVVLAAFVAVLHRYTGESDLLVAVGRSDDIMLLRMDVADDPSFADLIERVKLEMAARAELPTLPCDALLRDSLRNGHALTAHAAFFTGDANGFPLSADVPLDLALRYDGSTNTAAQIAVEYREALYERATIERLAGHITVLLDAGVRDPEQAISRLPLLTLGERQTLGQWNATETPYPTDRSIIALLREQVERSPQAIAVEFGDAQLTYRELDERVNRMASYLRARGVGPEVAVAVAMRRSLDMIVAVLGIQRAGGAYVPLDPDFPSDRIAFMLTDSGAVGIVTEEAVRIQLPHHAGFVVSVDQEREAIESGSAEPPPLDVVATQLAYVIYTSGSTGRPKGVQIEHRNLLNFLTGVRDEIKIGAGDTLLALAPLVFDIASLDIHFGLAFGARIVVASRDETRNPKALMSLIERSAATHIQATPSTFRMLLESGWEPQRNVTIMSTGEALPQALAERLLEGAGALWNLYGPTEATYVTMERIERGEPVTIGRPMPNVTTYILDSALAPVPIGVRGELYVGGAGITRGYRNRPELTGERFVTDPFAAASNARMYRTGDLARFRCDGRIEYLGRADFQVKLRGYRIEPGEIETLLEQRSDVRSAVVMIKDNPSGEQALAAYVAVEPGATFSATAIRRDLARALPVYMVPDAVVALDAFPLNANGKIDRSALAAAPFPAISRPDNGATCVRPRTPLEEQLTAIWEDVIGVRPIGTTDDFFELGASSLVAARLFDRIARELGAKLPLSPLFIAPTIQKLAALVEQRGHAQVGKSLVSIQTQGSGTPIFCVHGGDGTVLQLFPLAKRLGAAHPFYGLQMKGLYGDARPDLSVEQMARQYVREIRQIQPIGPYVLSGYCFGGIIAFEMAVQLQQASERVALLATLNGATPNYLRAHRSTSRENLSARELLRVTRRRAAALRNRFSLALDWHRPSGRRHQAFKEICDRAAQRYRPRAFSGAMLVIGSKGLFSDASLGWDRFAQGVETIEIPASHRNRWEALIPPHVDFVAARLQEALDRRLHRIDRQIVTDVKNTDG
jgi:amino acid adenylation domain-containing protein